MPMKTGAEYIESLRKLDLNLWMFGEKINSPVDHPIIIPSMNAVALTFDLAHEPEHEDLMTAVSHLTGKRINRFTHIYQSTKDLLKKVRRQRLLGQKTACCYQRCVGMDALNAIYSTTWEMDKQYGTDYHERFKEFLLYVQEEDLVSDGAMTDPKGDRSRRPHEQKDPDLYLRVVERRSDGIVVRGAKAHQTGIVNSHEVIVMPTISMTEKDRDYAVSFAIPTDTEGLLMIYGRQSCDTRKLEGSEIDVGNSRFGGSEALLVFEDVFIPRERIFMDGETDYVGMLVERFSGHHRPSYACKSGVVDVLIGATALAAEYIGVDKASHVKDKLVEMTHLNETMYACTVACSSEGFPTPSGAFSIDPMLSNVGKQNVTRFPYEIARLAEDIAGGLVVTLPSEKDYRHPELGRYMEKYYKGVSSVPTENRMRVLRLIEHMCMGAGSVALRTESMHGAGSPQAQRVMIGRLGRFDFKKDLAKEIAKIEVRK